MKKFIYRQKDNCGFGLIANTKNEPTHLLLKRAINALEKMMHRGGISADKMSGDGSGLLFSIPRKFMHKVAEQEGFSLSDDFAVAVLFTKDASHIDEIEKIANNNGLSLVGRRAVPINPDATGEQALASLPLIYHLFFEADGIPDIRFEPMLYLTRKEIEQTFIDDNDFYIPTLSNRVISYKGLVMPTHIESFFIDFQDDDFEISFALFHQRFSTNTLPQWKLAQPFRMIAHNGEINSIKANRFQAFVKQENAKSKIFSDAELKRLMPIIQPIGSDSASLDNFFEFLIVNGIDTLKAVRMLIPFPWQNQSQLSPKIQAFYEYTSTFCAAWDGPAAVAFTDGKYIGCVIDRNGLRPGKYTKYKDNTLVISSEHGVLDIPESEIITRGRLKSGEMIALNLDNGHLLNHQEIDQHIENSAPYSQWLNKNTSYFEEKVGESFYDIDSYHIDDLEEKQRFFNISLETIDQVIIPMANNEKENVGSMGDDTPLALFSNAQRSFFDFFRQKFAQVTNPAIDPYREKIVMSLNTSFGRTGNILQESEELSKRLRTSTPLLREDKLRILEERSLDLQKQGEDDYLKIKSYATTYTKDLKKSLDDLVAQIIKDVGDEKIRTVILDDRSIDAQKKCIPMAMVVGRLNYALLDNGYSSLVSVVAVSGEVIDAHGLTVLLSQGVNSIYPYMLFATIVDYFKDLPENEIKIKLKHSYKALKTGILKVMSKMGISTVYSYRNSSLHDIIGLSEDIVKDCFKNSDALLEGLDYDDIDQRVSKAHQEAFLHNDILPIKAGGFYNYLDGQEYHDFSPSVIYALQKAADSGVKKDFETFKSLIDNRDKKVVRDFLTLTSQREPIPLDEVESKSAIFKRFSTAAMSLGSISPEAHEALATAMNTIGGRSNSGEGGEDRERYGSIKNSQIKQVASGRFGVTPEYLRSASEIQIKVAQGAKPGEGGQLPGNKVSKLIAKLRYTNPGITLISPPPHHDIYSIEDLSQLIFDLKQVNPKAKVTVKLVSSIGVGVIAVGVAKAYADKIIISGNDGGTGAAPLTSIKYAGNPFELGLVEAHRALKANHLRKMVTLETDGGLKTGKDIIKAAILGAETFAFGTSALVMIGCKYLRVCHLNKCTVGVATQNPLLREHFTGTVKKVINYFTLLAEDVREILASLGYRSIEEIIGKTELLEIIDDKAVSKIDFSVLLEKDETESPDTCQVDFNEPFDANTMEKEMLSELGDVIHGNKVYQEVVQTIQNTNRSFGARICGEIAGYYGNSGFKRQIDIKLTGFAGQSFGAFLINGVSLYLQGCANDYVGKGMNGGKIIIKSQLQGEHFNTIGNTCLYGATGGKLFILGNAGERFAIRNSGAIGVVEGTGDHACEYMTGGIIVILGETGINFGAGMTGGAAFIYDEHSTIVNKINRELIEHIRIDIDDLSMEKYYLKKLLTQYYEETGSTKAYEILENFRINVKKFWFVKPKELLKVPLSSYDVD